MDCSEKILPRENAIFIRCTRVAYETSAENIHTSNVKDSNHDVTRQIGKKKKKRKKSIQ